MKRKFIFLFFCLCCLAGFAQGGKALDLKTFMVWFPCLTANTTHKEMPKVHRS